MAFKNITQYSPQAGSANSTSLFYAVISGNTDTSLPLSVLVHNLGLTGVPTVPTAVSGTNTTQIASTAFTQTAVSGGTYAGSFTTLSASSTVSGAGFTTLLAPYALLVSPTFTGTPAAPTASAGTNTTQLATTAYVQTALTGGANTASFTTISSTTSGSNSSITIADTGVNGANIKLTGNGGTTPSKTIRANGDNFQVINNAYTTTLLQVTDAGNLSVVGSIAPSTTAGLVGTTLGDNANAGSVGEYQNATASGVSLTTATYTNVISVSLTAGDWDVSGTVAFSNSAAAVNAYITGINTVSNTNPGAPNSVTFGTLANVQNWSIATPITRINVSATTTVYLGAQCNFTSGTTTASGWIRARRVR